MSTNSDLFNKYQLQSAFLERQVNFETELRKLSSESAKKDAIFNYLKLITSNPPITYDDFPEGNYHQTYIN